MKTSLFSVIASLLLFAGCATGWKARHTAGSSQELLDRVREHVPTVAMVDLGTSTSLAGHYTSGSGLAGEELYLFPDGTYMYTKWADIRSETLYDRGTWSCSEGFLRLSSDATLSKRQPRDKVYVALRYDGTHPLDSLVSKAEEERSGIVLMGVNWDYSMYIDFVQTDIEEGCKNLDVFENSFLTCTLKKTENIGMKDVAKMKRLLSERVWTVDLGD